MQIPDVQLIQVDSIFGINFILFKALQCLKGNRTIYNKETLQISIKLYIFPDPNVKSKGATF